MKLKPKTNPRLKCCMCDVKKGLVGIEGKDKKIRWFCHSHNIFRENIKRYKSKKKL